MLFNFSFLVFVVVFYFFHFFCFGFCYYCCFFLFFFIVGGDFVIKFFTSKCARVCESGGEHGD